jgi:thymidylate synthase
MSDGFPLLTTKKMAFKTMTTELLWFLRGDTNIKYLVDNDCHIWDGDAYKRYLNVYKGNFELDKEEFINAIKTSPEFATKWGELGPIYGKQWRNWKGFEQGWNEMANTEYSNDLDTKGVDQIANLINDLKTNPDSRRLMVNTWNVGELDQMVLPPCHYGFQVYTRELSLEERNKSMGEDYAYRGVFSGPIARQEELDKYKKLFDEQNRPTRAISLMWNQRSVDTFLGLPFNIASYGLLLEIIAKEVNMVPDELIGNLGDVHLYSNHVEQAKEQIGRELSLEERRSMVTQEMFNQIYNGGGPESLSHSEIDQWGIPRRTREPFPLPTLNINTEFWPYEGGECGVGPLDAIKVFEAFKDDNFCRCLLEEDIQLSNYQSHPSIKAPLSN